MSTSGPDPPQQTAFLTSASSSLATVTSIDNGSSSALPTSESSIQNGQPSLAPTVLPSFTIIPIPTAAPAPTVPGATPTSTTPATSSPIVTGLSKGGKYGLAAGIVVVVAVFFCWFWPKRHKFKREPGNLTSTTHNIKQTSVTMELKKTDDGHLAARAKTY